MSDIFISVLKPKWLKEDDYLVLNENYYDWTPVVTTGAQFTCILKDPLSSWM
jgi:hypothetical protein